jgi:hypothetical protein
MANNQNRNDDLQDQQGEGYQDPNEQESRDSRSDATSSEPLTSEPGTLPEGESSDEEDVDVLDEVATTISVKPVQTAASTLANSKQA